jgi:hypothetical protein
VGAVDEPPRRRFREWPITVVLLVVAVSLVIVANGHFRRGCVLLAGAVVLAFFLRVLLPSQEAGMLAVRSRRVDVAVLGVLGLAVSVLSLWVPPPS